MYTFLFIAKTLFALAMPSPLAEAQTLSRPDHGLIEAARGEFHNSSLPSIANTILEDARVGMKEESILGRYCHLRHMASDFQMHPLKNLVSQESTLGYYGSYLSSAFDFICDSRNRAYNQIGLIFLDFLLSINH